jgi:hypothetical protein
MFHPASATGTPLTYHYNGCPDPFYRRHAKSVVPYDTSEARWRIRGRAGDARQVGVTPMSPSPGGQDKRSRCSTAYYRGFLPERLLVQERVRAGLRNAKATGQRHGRPVPRSMPHRLPRCGYRVHRGGLSPGRRYGGAIPGVTPLLQSGQGRRFRRFACQGQSMSSGVIMSIVLYPIRIMKSLNKIPEICTRPVSAYLTN